MSLTSQQRLCLCRTLSSTKTFQEYESLKFRLDFASLISAFKNLRSFYKCISDNAKPHACFLSFIETEQSINIIIGNGKRFMASDIIKRLKENKESELLNLLSDAVKTKQRQTIKNMKYGNCLLI